MGAAFADEAVMDLVENPNPHSRGRLQVQFHFFPVRNAQKSLQEGRPIFENREFIRIFVPGDKDNVVDREVEETDKQRFAQEYAAWLRGKEAPLVGTPLAAWPGVDRAQVAELEFFRVRTVEELADLADVHAGKFRGIQALRQKARDWLQAAKGNAPLEQMRSELAAAQRQQTDQEMELEALRAQVKELQAQASERTKKG